MDEPTVSNDPPISFQQNICRTCLTRITPPAGVPIFTDEPFFKGQSLCQTFKEIMSTLLDPDELLPRNICRSCTKRLKQAVAFKHSIDQAEIVLRSNVRLAEMKHSMNKTDSVASTLDSLCSTLLEIENEYKKKSVQEYVTKANSKQTKKPIDINKIRTWQANLDDIVSGKTSNIAKAKHNIKITNKVLNPTKPAAKSNAVEVVKIPSSKIVNQPVITIEESSNIVNPAVTTIVETNNEIVFQPVTIVEPNSEVLSIVDLSSKAVSRPNIIRKPNPNTYKSNVAIFSGKEFVDQLLMPSGSKNSSNSDVGNPHFNPQDTSKVYKKKNHTDLDILNNIMNDSDIGDTIILIEDTEDVFNGYQLIQEDPKEDEANDDIMAVEDYNKAIIREAEKENKTTRDCNLEECNFEKEEHNLEEEISWIKEKCDKLIDPEFFKMHPDKPIACQKCDKRFTNIYILQRHLLYHSLQIEPKSDGRKSTHCNVNYGVYTPMELYRERKARRADEEAFYTALMDSKPQNSCEMDAVPTEISIEQLPSVPEGAVATAEQIGGIAYDHDYTSLSQREPTLSSLILRKLLAQPRTIHMYTRKCRYCKEPIQHGKMEQHLRERHREELRRKRKLNYICHICKKAHCSRKSLMSHVRTRHEQKLKCDHCDKGFNRKDYLMQHMSKFHGVRSVSLCYICGKMVSSGSVSLHIRTHGNEKPFKCTYKDCTASLKYKSTLLTHIQRIHGTEKPFICEQCGKMYSTKDGLRQHLRTHIKVKPYYCDICERYFTTPFKYKRHLLVQHQRHKPYTCPICPQVFGYKESIKKHCVRYHPEHPLAQNRPPSLCIKYKAPKDKKSFECTLCQRKFTYEFNLKKHTRTFHPTTYYRLQ